VFWIINSVPELGEEKNIEANFLDEKRGEITF